MKRRKSYHLTQLQNELRKRAIKEKNEEKRRDYWRMFFKAKHAEHEVRELVMDAEMRRLLDFMRMADFPDGFDDDIDIPQQPRSQAPDDDDIDDEDIPPRQKGLWDE